VLLVVLLLLVLLANHCHWPAAAAAAAVAGQLLPGCLLRLSISTCASGCACCATGATSLASCSRNLG